MALPDQIEIQQAQAELAKLQVCFITQTSLNTMYLIGPDLGGPDLGGPNFIFN